MAKIPLILDYIKENLPNLEQSLEDTRCFSFIEDNEEKHLVVIEEKILDVKTEEGIQERNLLFSQDFKLLVSEEELSLEADYYAFEFGEQFYYISKENTDSPQLNILRYLGNNISDLQQSTDFCHLAVHGVNELLQGCQKYEHWCKKANYLGINSLGICEKHTLGSAIKFQKCCQKYNIKPILGETITVKIGETLCEIKVYAKNKEGWKNIVNLSNVLRVFKAQDNLNSLEEDEF